jgi:glycosyltransferase involved in cell wall biosynthesis
MIQQKHILHVFPTFAIGGSQMRFAQLTRLHADRYRHTIIALDGNFEMAESLPKSNVTLETMAYDKHDLIGSLTKFSRTLNAVRPDVLMTYNWGAIEWAIANRLRKPIRHLHVEDGFGPEEASGQLRRRAWTRRFALAGRFTSVILPSRTLEEIARKIWKLPLSRLNYVPNGINYARFAGQLENGNDVITIGTVASLRREKNISRLIEAFGKIKTENRSRRLNLTIVGDGPERPLLQSLTAQLKLSDSVLFAGASARPEDWLRRMDIFALSSDTEQMPLGVLEAMAAGLPVVSTAVGDVARMVADENRPFVVEAGFAYEKALRTLVGNAELRLYIGAQNTLRAAKMFDETTMAARYAELIG